MSATSRPPTLGLSSLRPQNALSLLKELYHRAPASVGTIGSLLPTYIASTAWADYRLWLALGPGGPLPYNLFGWALHNIFLVPIALSRRIRTSSSHIYVEKSSQEPTYISVSDLHEREGERPTVKGCAPHRCLDQRLKRDGRAQKNLVSYLKHLGESHPSLVNFSEQSAIETAGSSPSLRHHPSASSGSSSPLAAFYLSLLPSREFIHLHREDGSMHCILSSQDAQTVIDKKWGELHPLAGLGLPGFWYPFFPFHYRNARGRYPPIIKPSQPQQSSLFRVPKSYVMIYPPRTDAKYQEDDVAAVKMIIEASVGFATGVNVSSYRL